MKSLCLSVHFSHGAYNGEEWPPSPRRLFHALLAGNRIGCRKLAFGNDEEAAIRWLESLDPPEILVPPHTVGGRHVEYGKNNDAKRENVEKWHCPRHCSEPLIYRWRIADGEERLAETIARMSQRIIALGLGKDSAWAHGAVVDAESNGNVAGERQRYRPVSGAGNLKLSVPYRGIYDLIEARWERRTQWPKLPHRDRMASYAIGPDAQFEVSVFRLEDREHPGFLVAFPWSSSVAIAAWTRHAAGVAMEGADPSWVSRLVMGHCERHEIPHRWAYVPLPWVDPKFGDGMIRRIAVLWRKGPNGEGAGRLDGFVLTDPAGRPKARIVADRTAPKLAQASSAWRSVTPVVFRRHWLRKGRPRWDLARRMIESVIADVGISPEWLVDFDVRSEPFFRGCLHANQASAPKHLRSYPRMHLGLRFRQPVTGPLVLGHGRYAGLGLMAPDVL